MIITILGCWGGFPRPDGATSGYLFEQDNYKILVECGSAVVSKLLSRIKIQQLNAVLLSHYHNDHFCDVGVLQYARLVNSQIGVRMGCLPIYAPTNDKKTFELLTMLPYTQAMPFRVGAKLKIGPFSINFYKCIHPLECYAMRITAGNHSVFYTADTAYSESLAREATGCDLMLAESSLYPDHSGKAVGHMTSVQAAKLAENANVGELILTHLPAYGNFQMMVDSAQKAYSGIITLAEEGLTRRLI